MKERKLRLPGQSAIEAYIRKLMADGKWRVTNDVVSRAVDDGMAITPNAVGRAMGKFVEDGYLREEGTDGRRMWKLRRREAAE